METNIVGRNLGITDRFRSYASEKAEKIAGLADKALALEVKLSRNREKGSATGNDRVELTLIGKGPIVRAEADGSDKYAAFDVALGRLLERVRRAKDRQKLHRGGAHRPTSLHDAASVDFSVVDIKPADAETLDEVRTGVIRVIRPTESEAAAAAVAAEEEADEVYTPVVIRRKVFSAAPMTVDDALYFMELVGHDFYLFQDSETNRPSVVYRRKGWDYGVIELDENSEELRVAAE